MKHHIRRLFLTILVSLALMPDSKACYIEYCYNDTMWDCQGDWFAYPVTYWECYEYEDCYDDGEEYYCFYDTYCYEWEDWEYYYDEVCDWIDVWDCWYDWDPDCGGGGGGDGNIVLQVTINPDTNQTLNLGQSVVYSSTASVSGDALVSHDFDWMAPGGNWVSGSSNSAGPGTMTLGALTGGADRSLPVDMQTSSTRSLTMTPTQPGSYSVRFSASGTSGEWGHSSTKTLTVDNVMPVQTATLPQSVYVGTPIIMQFSASNPTTFFHYLISYQIEEKRTDANGIVYQDWTTLANHVGLTGTQTQTWSGTASAPARKGTVTYRFQTGNQWPIPSPSNSGQLYTVIVLDLDELGADGIPIGLIDSNGNGIPDLIEQRLGLNPATPGNTIPANLSRQYDYDAVRQLIQSPERTYQLDAEGNIKNK
jgi:hypothetical protein